VQEETTIAFQRENLKCKKKRPLAIVRRPYLLIITWTERLVHLFFNH